jgi:Flp pilus assembly protein TadD
MPNRAPAIASPAPEIDRAPPPRAAPAPQPAAADDAAETPQPFTSVQPMSVTTPSVPEAQRRAAPPTEPAVARPGAPALTLEPPQSRRSIARGFSRATDKAVRGATPTGRTEPSDTIPATTPAEEAVPDSTREQAAARPRPAGEPLGRARSLVERGKIQEAIEVYLGVLTVNPSNLMARNSLGVLFDELKQFDAARDHLEAAARLEPENVEVLTNLASTLTSLARYEEAEAVIKRAQKVDAEDVRVRTSIGILCFRRGLYQQAEAELRWICSRHGDNGVAFYYRGEALNRMARYDEAEQALERAAELLPNDPRPVYTLGTLYDRKHLPEEAAEMYRRARRLQKR